MDFPLITGEVFHGRPSVADTAPADAEIVDISGYGITLTDTNITQTRTQQGRQVNVYNGTSSKHENTSVTTLPVLCDATILTWAYADFAYAGASRRIFEIRDTAGENIVLFNRHSTPTWRASWVGNTTSESANYDDSSLVYTWNMFGLVKEGANLSVVINGVIKVTETSTADMVAKMDLFGIGSDRAGGAYWQGYIDPELTIWGYALSAEQLAQEYNRLCHYFGRAKI